MKMENLANLTEGNSYYSLWMPLIFLFLFFGVLEPRTFNCNKRNTAHATFGILWADRLEQEHDIKDKRFDKREQKPLIYLKDLNSCLVNSSSRF